MSWILPHTMAELYTSWASNYPCPPPQNWIIKSAWAILPKVISWQLWLERNRRTFKNDRQHHKIIEVKIKCQIKECLSQINDDANLTHQDNAWGSFLGLQFLPTIRKAPPLREWQIRKTEADFQDWFKSQASYFLFFDGASKGNPGKAGAGDVVLNLTGKKIHSFAWGLGHMTSTQAEALTLLQGLKTLKELNIREATVIGDSQIIISAMISKSPPANLKLARMIFRIKALESDFQKLNYYHVLRAHNKEVDSEANKAALLSTGVKLKEGK